MTISFESWNTWRVVKCNTNELELVIGISAGPRILSFSYQGGNNLLYQDHTDFGVADWRLYGGHRFTVAPEDEESYYPDNDPCEVKLLGALLQVSAKQRANGIKLSLEITELPTGGFSIKHMLHNNGTTNWEGALWAITCVPRSAAVAASCLKKDINFWPGTDASKWQQSNGVLTVTDGNQRGKAGWYSPSPELMATSSHGKFIITSPDVADPGLCVDNGSNVELFVCADFAELETLGEKVLVMPGGVAEHVQHWRCCI